MEEVFSALEKVIPPKYAIYSTFGWVLVQNAGRAYHAIASGGGLVGIVRGLLFGTNTVTQKQTNEKTTV